MKFRLALAAFLTFAVATVSADIPLRPSHANLLLGPTAGGGGSSYTGVGDIVSGMYIWAGVQALSGAYASAHGNLYVLSKVSSGETCNIPSLSTGLPGLTTGCSAGSNGQTAASFCSSSSTTCHMEFYDQSGASNNFTNGAAVNGPYWDVSTGCAYFSAANLNLQNVSNVSALSQPLTFYLVAESITGSGGAVFTNNGGPQWLTQSSANTWQFDQGGGANYTVPDNAFATQQYVLNNGSSEVYIDGSGTVLGTNNSSSMAVAQIEIGLNGQHFLGYVCEVGYIAGDQTAHVAAVNSNQRTRYGF